MSSQTPNLNLVLPVGTEKVSRQIINDNNTKIDTAVGSNSQAIANLKNDIAIVEDTDTATHTITAGQYVVWKGSLYVASTAIPAGSALSLTNLLAVTDGGLNALGSGIAKHISNANGDAWKFDSGLMICTKTVTQTMACTTAWGQLYESTVTMDFGLWPVAFTAPPVVTGNVVDGSLASWFERFLDVSATSAGNSYIVRPTSATNSCKVCIIGIGFWK